MYQKIGTTNVMKTKTIMKDKTRKTIYPLNRILVFTDTNTKMTVKRYSTSRQYNY